MVLSTIISRKEIARSIREVAPDFTDSEVSLSSYFIESPFQEYLVSPAGKERLRDCFSRIKQSYGENTYKAFLPFANEAFRSHPNDPESALVLALETANETVLEESDLGRNQSFGHLKLHASLGGDMPSDHYPVPN